MREGSAWLRHARTALPFAVSGAILVFLLSRFDVAEMWRHWTLEAAAVFAPSLLVYGAVSLWLEAASLVRVVPGAPERFGWWDAARSKAASYLLVLLHYALGAGSLVVLVRRRAGIPLAAAASVVLLLSLLDLLMLLALGGAGAVAASRGAPALQLGLVLGGVGAIVAGFAVLRAPVRLGPLDRLRDLRVFAAARSVPLPVLVQLGVLRFAMVLSFVSVSWSALYAFGIDAPLGLAVANLAAVALVGTLPFTAAGLGTGQAAFVYLFRDHGTPEVLLACSLALSLGLIALRAGIGLGFAGEYTRVALEATRSGELGEAEVGS